MMDGPRIDQHEQQRCDQQLIGDRIQHAAERRLLLPGAGQIAVEKIGDCGGGKDPEGDPARQVGWQVRQRETGDDDGNRGYAAVGEDIR
jgi:hypothetical protein